jgi:hypothetical protein
MWTQAERHPFQCVGTAVPHETAASTDLASILHADMPAPSVIMAGVPSTTFAGAHTT